jgi:hypothetical protein
MKRKEVQVLQIDAISLQSLLIYDTVEEAAKANDISTKRIKQVCQGKLLTAGGYIWTYIPKR